MDQQNTPSAIHSHTTSHSLVRDCVYELTTCLLYNTNITLLAQSSVSCSSYSLSTASTSKAPTTLRTTYQQRYILTETPDEAPDEVLLAQISNGRSQPGLLLLDSLITSLKRCFHLDLTRVDFTRSLIGLDYLDDLQSRTRGRAIQEHEHTRSNEGTHSNKSQPQRKLDTASQETKTPCMMRGVIESLYADLYVELRRWVGSLL
jgi:hypothetical protein